jgi:hypothetical protein
MTVIQSYLAEILDLKALQITCSKCHCTSRIPREHLSKFPNMCRHCEKPWWGSGSSDQKGVEDLVNGLTTLSKRAQDATPIIHFEFPLPNQQ